MLATQVRDACLESGWLCIQIEYMYHYGERNAVTLLVPFSGINVVLGDVPQGRHGGAE